MKIPFTLDAWLKDKSQKVETRSGKNVRIICWDKIGIPIVALVGDADDIVTYNRDGTTGQQMQLPSDLFLVTPEEELTEFEKAVGLEIFDEPFEEKHIKVIKEESAKLLALARKELIKEGTSKNEMGTMLYDAGFEDGKAEALRTHATELTENLIKSGLDKDSIHYHLVEFMCNLYDCPNWKEIEGSAELYAKRIKAAAMKDLPRWKKHEEASDKLATVWNDFVTPWLDWRGHRIAVRDLEKLPGFKEDSHE